MPTHAVVRCCPDAGVGMSSTCESEVTVRRDLGPLRLRRWSPETCIVAPTGTALPKMKESVLDGYIRR